MFARICQNGLCCEDEIVDDPDGFNAGDDGIEPYELRNCSKFSFDPSGSNLQVKLTSFKTKLVCTFKSKSKA